MSDRRDLKACTILVACAVGAACASAPRATVSITDVAIEPSHGCRIGVTARFVSEVDDAIVGVDAPFGTVSLHPLVGGPAIGGHEGHLDNDGGHRPTRVVTSVALARGVTTLRAHDLVVFVDGGPAALRDQTSADLTFRFRSSRSITRRAPVRLATCR